MNATADTTSTLTKINADKSCFDWINERVTFSETDFITQKISREFSEFYGIQSNQT